MLESSPLGRSTTYVETYTPSLLYPIPRTFARNKTGIHEVIPFKGVDIWNAFELSWLNEKGKPEIAIGELIFSCASKNIVESKSLKLYFNSFNQTRFDSIETVQSVIETDLKLVIGDDVIVRLYRLNEFIGKPLEEFNAISLDTIDVEIDTYHVEKNFLQTSNEKVKENLFTTLFKSNCLATGQPDWGAVYIRYEGNQIDHEGLLKYLISFRNHSGFAEHCVEQIYHEIMEQCQPEKLSVYARYTRRGGLDINPFRSNFEDYPSNNRQVRQ